MAKVYVSSTFVDLEDCRRQVSILLRRMGHEDVAMEYYTAGDQRPVDKCLSYVAASGLYVGIFAWRYGWIPPDNNPEQLSVTEMEYRQAVRSGKECLIFLLHEDALWPRKFVDRDPLRIDQLRTHLSNKHLCAFFKSAEDVGSVVGPAIYNWAKENGHISPGVFDLEAYCVAIKKRYQRLDLEGLTPPQREEYLQLQLRSVFVEQNVRENPPPVELPKGTWERLHREKEIHLEDLPEGVTPEDIGRLRESYYEKPVRAALDVLTETWYQRAIILGDPGSGKSTLARYMLLSLIYPAGDERLRGAFDGYLPLLIELRSYAGLCADKKCKTFLEFLEYLGETEGWHLTKNALHQHLKNDGHAVVIFDGLDEIFDPEERERITRQIVGFASDYKKARIIATSRIIGYRRKILTDAEFAHFTLQDLDESQVATFVDRWYGLALSDRPEEAKERSERILRSFKESTSIRQLAGNPMLLTIMAIIGKHQELPRERWKLYDHAASVLIEHWDVNRHLKDQSVQADFIGQDEKKEMLRRLAFKMQSGAGGRAGNYIHWDELQAEFESYLKERYNQPADRAVVISRAIIAQFRERNFILSLYGANLYGFVHRAFLEFFCASALVNKFEKTQEMTLEQLKRDVYGLYWKEQSWHEVLRLICGIIGEKFVGEIIDYLISEIPQPDPELYYRCPAWNIALSINCLTEVKNHYIIAESAKRLLQSICFLIDSYMTETNVTLHIDDFLEKHIVAPSELIGPNWPHREVLIGWLRRRKPLDYEAAFAEPFGKFVAIVGKESDGIHQLILEYASHSNESYRVLAPYALAVGWHNDPRTLPLLRDQAVNDNDRLVRGVALSALAKYFNHDPETLHLVRDRAVNDEDVYVRCEGISALAAYFNTKPETLTLLQERALSDEDGQVRKEAISVISKYFSGDPETLRLVQDRMFNDADGYVRSEAIFMLARYFQDDPLTFHILYDCAVKDSFLSVRCGALSSLAENYRDNPKVLSLLQDVVGGDFPDSICTHAVSLLSKYYNEKPETLPLLYDRAVNHSNEYMRQTAIFALSSQFCNAPKTLSILRDRAINDASPWVRRRAIIELIEHFHNQANTLALVRFCILNDSDPFVRQAATSMLAEYFYKDASTLSLLSDRAINDSDEYVRSVAISVLARYFYLDSQVLELLCNCLINDIHPHVRLTTAFALAEHFRNDPKTLLLLKKQASDDLIPWNKEKIEELIKDLSEDTE